LDNSWDWETIQPPTDNSKKRGGEQMRTDEEGIYYRTGRTHAEQDWSHIQNIAIYKSENRRGYDYLEALADAMTSRMNWMMKTGNQDAYRLGYMMELGIQIANEIKHTERKQDGNARSKTA